MRKRFAFVLCLASASASALLLAPRVALAAEPSSSASCKAYQEQKIDSGQAVTFCDDPMLAGDGAPLIAATGQPGRAFRANLIRPRTQFLTELLRTVETL